HNENHNKNNNENNDEDDNKNNLNNYIDFIDFINFINHDDILNLVNIKTDKIEKIKVMRQALIKIIESKHKINNNLQIIILNFEFIDLLTSLPDNETNIYNDKEVLKTYLPLLMKQEKYTSILYLLKKHNDALKILFTEYEFCMNIYKILLE